MLFLKVRMGELRVNIESMAFKGFGVARVHGKVIFIPYCVTGDEIWVEIVEEKKNYSMGKLKKIIKPSPWRVDPKCPYFGRCGGCQWQHIDASIQGELKKEILKEVLKRLGGLKEMPCIGLVPSPQPYGYRVRVQLKAKGESIGYYQERSHRLVDINHCPIAHPLINQILPSLRAVPLFFARMDEIEMNVSPEEGKGVLIIHTPSFQQGMENFMNEFLQDHPVLKGIAVKKKEGFTFFGEPPLYFTVPLNRSGEKRYLTFRTSPESFFQVNLEQNQRLIRTVIEFGDVKKDEKVLDLYAGVGNFTLPLATKAKEVLGIEGNSMAVEDAQFNAEENGIKQCRFILGRVEEVLKHWRSERYDLIVLDPPRTGCKAVADQMVGLKPKKIVYISCEPTVLSRDLRLFLKRGYQLQKLTLIDMFPQTYHMEVVALLKSLYSEDIQ
jgi:23S rRNA (uracil1939-C5)-methyltransferase